jgi:FlaG/FlaF family flagellin (archaellin)
MRQDRGEEGVSEVIGVVLLVGVTVLAVAVVAAVFLSGPQPDEIPRATIVAGSSESGSLALVHEGGDPLREGEYRIYVENESGFVDGTGSFSKPEDGVWSIGGALVYNGAETPERVVVTAISGGSETILAEPEFRGAGAGFSPDPVEPGVTPAPTPDGNVTISLPEGGAILKKDAEITAMIRSNQTAYVHLILYNYNKTNQETSGKNGGKGLAFNMTPAEVEGLYTLHLPNISEIGNDNDTIAVTVIAYNENDNPIASLTKIGILHNKGNKDA